MADVNNALLPGLPDDIATSILLSLPLPHQLRLRPTSRRISSLLSPSTSIPLRLSLRLPPIPLLTIFPSDPSLTPPLLFCPLSLAFLALPPLPCSPFLYSLTRFSAVSVPPFVYIIGGSLFDTRSYPLGHPSPSSAVFRFDLSATSTMNGSEWERVEDMSSARGSFACARTRNGDVIVAGGGSRHSVYPSHGSRISSVERYRSSSQKWETLQPLPKFRAGCTGFTRTGTTGTEQEEEFWVMGGYGEYTTLAGIVPADVYYKDAEVLDLKSGTWRTVPDMWDEGERLRLGPLAVLEGVGGEEKEVFMLYDNRIFRYNFDSNRWLKETNLRKKVHNESCGFTSMNGEIYVLTSALKSDGSDFKRPYRMRPTLEIQVYNPKIKKWRFYIVHPLIFQPIDFTSVILCPVRI
ncbi:hypothetical protein LUZ60_006709 [Juncus effusus]|nr:hypothetical protein LUZ60_006709 [Juncus effusus]